MLYNIYYITIGSLVVFTATNDILKFTNVFFQITICTTSKKIIVAVMKCLFKTFSNKFNIIYHFLQLLFAVLVDLGAQSVLVFAVLVFKTVKNIILMFKNVFYLQYYLF